MQPKASSGVWARVEELRRSVAALFGAGATSRRLEVLAAVLTVSAERWTIAERLDLDPTLVSRYLNRLLRAGIVARVRRGQHAFYTVGPAVHIVEREGKLCISIWEGDRVAVGMALARAEADMMGLGALAELVLPHPPPAADTNGHPEVITRPVGVLAPKAGVPKATRLPSGHAPE